MRWGRDGNEITHQKLMLYSLTTGVASTYREQYLEDTLDRQIILCVCFMCICGSLNIAAARHKPNSHKCSYIVYTIAVHHQPLKIVIP